MKLFLSLLTAAALSTGILALSASNAKAAGCWWVKEDPSCWGDTCRMRKVCGYGQYRPGGSTTFEGSRYGSRRPYGHWGPR